MHGVGNVEKLYICRKCRGSVVGCKIICSESRVLGKNTEEVSKVSRKRQLSILWLQKCRGSVVWCWKCRVWSKVICMFCYYESVEGALYDIESVEEAWTGARPLVLKVVVGAKTPRKCAKCRGSVAPKSSKARVQRVAHIAHSNSSWNCKCRGSVVPVGGRQTTCRWNFKEP